MREFKKVSVIGGGQMGRQIAVQIALNGFRTICYALGEEEMKKAQEFKNQWVSKQKAKRRVDETLLDCIETNLSYTTDMEEACKGADIVVEAVVDILEIKREALREASKFTDKGTVFVSNSSYIASSNFADVVPDSSKVCNMHFFNPALVMKVVEVVRGPHTSEETFELVCQFTEKIGKEPIRVNKEIYGFVVNRIFSALTREACYLYDMGIASFEDIDKAVKGGLNHPMGPFELLDMTGIDLEYNVYMEKFRDSGDSGDRPAVCLTERYAKGAFGRKNGKGFYEY